MLGRPRPRQAPIRPGFRRQFAAAGRDNPAKRGTNKVKTVMEGQYRSLSYVGDHAPVVAVGKQPGDRGQQQEDQSGRLTVGGIEVDPRRRQANGHNRPLQPAQARMGHHISYSPWCVPTVMNGVKVVVVHTDLREAEPMAWDFVMNFAKDNDLQVVEACLMPDAKG